MKVVIDNSRNITVNTMNIEALNSIQMQAHMHVESIKLEAAQALGSAEAVFNRMSQAHEQERSSWHASHQDVVQRLHAEANQQIMASNANATQQLLALRTEMAADANAQLAAGRNVLETQQGSHTMDM